MRITLTPAWTKVLSGFFVNLAAGWFGVIFIAPTFMNNPIWPIVLTTDIFGVILSLILAVALEKKLYEFE